MAWFYLILAGLAEVVSVISIKYSNGFTRLKPSFIFLIAMGTSFYSLSLSLLTIPIGTAYGIWTGIGSAGSVSAGMFLFGESRDIKKVIFVSCIIISVIGLKITAL